MTDRDTSTIWRLGLVAGLAGAYLVVWFALVPPRSPLAPPPPLTVVPATVAPAAAPTTTVRSSPAAPAPRAIRKVPARRPRLRTRSS